MLDPATPSTLYAGTNTYKSADNGVFKSTDAGDSWSKLDAGVFGLPSPDVTTLAIDPLTPSTLYAGVGQPYGMFKTTDAGRTWSGTGFYGPVRALAIDPITPSTLCVSAGQPGMFKSTDAGSTWSAANTAGLPIPFEEFVTALAIDPAPSGTLYAGTTKSVFKSTDAGSSWSETDSPIGYVTALAIDPTTPSTLYAGTGEPSHGGVFDIEQVPPVPCVGDCNNDQAVTIDELLILVNIALGNPGVCPNGVPAGATVDVSLIITAVNHALDGCAG